MSLMAYGGAYANKLALQCGRLRTNLIDAVAALVAKQDEPFMTVGDIEDLPTDCSNKSEIADILDEMPKLIEPYLRSLGAANRRAITSWRKANKAADKLRAVIEGNSNSEALQTHTGELAKHLAVLERLLNNSAIQETLICGEISRRQAARNKAPTLEPGNESVRTAPGDQEEVYQAIQAYRKKHLI